MCTAISYKTKDHYFGRNLDLEYSYEETVAVTPRNFGFEFRRCGRLERHFAMIGMAFVVDGYPLYYDATNEKGLSMAGLLFAGNAYYNEETAQKDNVTPFEFIPWILGQCATVAEAKKLLEKINLVDISFSEQLQLTPMHWMVADRDSCIVVESVAEGLKVHENPVGVLTNNPPFEYQMMNLNNYLGLFRGTPENRFAAGLELNKYSRGMGAMGLPGDLSSASRFVRAAFHKMNAVAGESEAESVNQFFHLLGSVEMPRGSLELEENVYEITVYSSCCNTDRGIYYYTTYENRQIVGIDMYKEDLEGDEVISYGLVKRGGMVMGN
ncbi:MAG: choloylglycine hydrolase [Lachnospiraceae bacterium]|nr:choloylglycine hydrolase [Lachnospiraceae bacterium]